MDGHDHAAGQPDAGIRGEVKRLVGDAHVHRLVGGEARPCKGIAHRMHFIKKLLVGKPGEGLARGEALSRLGEQRAEIQARREIENVGGSRSDCATTQ